jgi:hypothetical protein
MVSNLQLDVSANNPSSRIHTHEIRYILAATAPRCHPKFFRVFSLRNICLGGRHRKASLLSFPYILDDLSMVHHNDAGSKRKCPLHAVRNR